MFFDKEKLNLQIGKILSDRKADKKALLAFAVCMIVIIFVVLSEFSDVRNEKITYDKDINYINGINNDELEKFLENVDGAGNVEIMITYDSSEEYIYAKDTNENTRDKKESDNEINYKTEHIIIKEDGNEKGLTIKEIYPEIRGIAVICDGGNNPIIKECIVSMLSALFGINTNKISVAAKSS